jgi:ribosomal protein S30
MAELPDVGSIDTLLEEKALQKKLLSLSEKERRKYFEDRRRQLKKYQEFFDNKPLMNKSQSGLAIMLAADRLRDLDLLTRTTNKNRPTIESLESEIQNLRNEKRMVEMNFAEGDVVELPDVGSIQPLTEDEKRKAFGTPLTRALKMDPISMERSPVKRGIASIGSNMLDMLPGFSFQKGMQEGDPIQMGMGITDLIPGAALLKVGSKAVTDLANKLARMAPEDIAAVKGQYNPVFRNIFEQQERIINAAGATNADKAAAREVQRKINANYSIMFDNAGVKFDG